MFQCACMTSYIDIRLCATAVHFLFFYGWFCQLYSVNQSVSCLCFVTICVCLWMMTAILSTPSSSNRGAGSVTGCCFLNAAQTDSETILFPEPSDCTTPMLGGEEGKGGHEVTRSLGLSINGLFLICTF